MFLINLNFFKYLFFFSIFLLGLFLIINGKYILDNFNQITLSDKKIENEYFHKNIKNNNLKKNYQKKTYKKIIKSNQKSLIEKIIFVKKNDTFSKILKSFLVDDSFRNKVIYAINKKFNLRNLNIDQKIIFNLNNDNKVYKIIIPIDFFTELIVILNNDEIKIHKQKIYYNKEINSLEFSIQSSLYEDGIKAGLPLDILTDAIRLYSFDLDFQRDIKKNTIFQISYEKFFNEKRNETEYGNIEYINIIIKGKKIEYFIFKTSEGFFDYFDKEGKNVKKSLLKTPIDGAKLSSSFGMRKHPISGFNKLHKGVDFAAPKGTPIFAGGNGVIEYASRNGGYGKYIRIRHNNEYKTAYAHLSNFKKGISKGKKINQGEVIGYVGTSGKSTGPHLHYEIILKGKQINPMKMKLPSRKILKGEELDQFKQSSKNIYAEYLFTLYE